MTIPQLRQEAKDLRDLANRFLLYGEKHSLDVASRRLAELFRHVPLVLGNRARGLTLEGVPKAGMRSQSTRTTSYRFATMQSLRQLERSRNLPEFLIEPWFNPRNGNPEASKRCRGKMLRAQAALRDLRRKIRTAYHSYFPAPPFGQGT